MPMIDAGCPLKRPICLYESAPSSTRATSPTRTAEPSGLMRTTIFANSSGVESRPCARTVYVNSCPFGADLAGRIHRALRLHRLLHIGDGEAELRELVRLQPDAHRVLGRAEVHDLPHARHAVDRVVDVDERVVAEEEAVVRAFGGVERDQHQRHALRLAVRDAELVDLRRQAGQRLRHAILRVDLVAVAVRADVERDALGDGAVARVDGLDVERVLHAVHLLLDRLRARLLEGESGRAGGWALALG